MDIIFNKGGITAPEGFLASGVHCGIKKCKKDIAVVYSRVPAAAAGVFTTNKVKAAPLKVTMENLKNRKAQAIVVNSGNANACTGEDGLKDAKEMAELTAKQLKCGVEDVVVASTGVIGVKMPMDKVRDGIVKCCSTVSKEGGSDAACAIMTTDTFKKEVTVSMNIGGKKITIGAMAKGSGMIHPNMATMLCFISTDARIKEDALEKALRLATARSFNMISVDGDTSTNDMAVIFANGLAGNRLIEQETEDFDEFYRGLEIVCVELAKMMVKDGEGATKFMEVEVKNAPDDLSAVMAARSITRSNLVKTAIFGEDANWGRIICAVGYSGVDFDPNLVDIYISGKGGELMLAQNGMGIDFSEDKAKELLKEKDIKVIVDLKQGCGHATAWGCDLSYDYVKINGSYRT